MNVEKMKAKTPSASETVKTEIVCADDTNPMGIETTNASIQLAGMYA